MCLSCSGSIFYNINSYTAKQIVWVELTTAHSRNKANKLHKKYVCIYGFDTELRQNFLECHEFPVERRCCLHCSAWIPAWIWFSIGVRRVGDVLFARVFQVTKSTDGGAQTNQGARRTLPLLPIDAAGVTRVPCASQEVPLDCFAVQASIIGNVEIRFDTRWKPAALRLQGGQRFTFEVTKTVGSIPFDGLVGV